MQHIVPCIVAVFWLLLSSAAHGAPGRALKGGKVNQRVRVRLFHQDEQGKLQPFHRCDSELSLVSTAKLTLSEGGTGRKGKGLPESLLPWMSGNVFEGIVPEHGEYEFRLVVRGVPPSTSTAYDTSFIARLDWTDDAPPSRVEGASTQLDGRARITIHKLEDGWIEFELLVPSARLQSFAQDHESILDPKLGCPQLKPGRPRDPDGDRTDRRMSDVEVVPLTIEEKGCVRARPNSFGLFTPMPMVSVNGDRILGDDPAGFSTNPGIGIGLRWGFTCRTITAAPFSLRSSILRDRERIEDLGDAAEDIAEAVRDEEGAEHFNRGARDAILLFYPELQQKRPWYGVFEVGLYIVGNYEGHRGNDLFGRFDSGLALTLEINPFFRRTADSIKSLKHSRIRDFRFAVGGRMWWDRIADETGELAKWQFIDATRWGILIGFSFGVDFLKRDTYRCDDGRRDCKKEEIARILAQRTADFLTEPEAEPEAEPAPEAEPEPEPEDPASASP